MKKFSKAYVDPNTRDSHKPIVSEKNAQLAQKKRAKMAGGNENVTFVEILL